MDCDSWKAFEVTVDRFNFPKLKSYDKKIYLV